MGFTGVNIRRWYGLGPTAVEGVLTVGEKEGAGRLGMPVLPSFPPTWKSTILSQLISAHLSIPEGCVGDFLLAGFWRSCATL